MIARRKTGSSRGSGIMTPFSVNSFYQPISNGPSTAPHKSASGNTRSLPDSPNEDGPARKKPRLGASSAANLGANGNLLSKSSAELHNGGSHSYKASQPLQTESAGVEAQRPQDHSTRHKHISETGGGSHSKRLSSSNTQRKFAPRVGLAFRSPTVTGNELGDRSVLDSPLARGTATQGPSATESPQREGREFAGNQSVRAWFSQRDSFKSEPSRERSILDDNKNPFNLPRAFRDQPASRGSTSSVASEKRTTHEDHWPLPPSLIDSSARGSYGFARPGQPNVPSNQQQASLSIFQKTRPEQSSGRDKVPRSPPAKPVSNLDFDSLIYGQEGAASPPRGVTVVPRAKPPPPPKPEPPDEPFYAHIDPRLHWPQPHTAEWYEKKHQEIEARDGRKANFGKAAQRLKQQRQKEESVSWEDAIPAKIREDPAWLRAYLELHEVPSQEETLRKKTGQRGPKTVKPGLKRQASSAGPSTPKKSAGFSSSKWYH